MGTGIARVADMRMQMVVVVVLALSGCEPDFEAGAFAFTSSLSRDGSKWTPLQPVALGTKFFFDVEYSRCGIDCPRVTDLEVATSGTAVTGELTWARYNIATRESGVAVVSVKRPDRSGDFRVSVREATQTRWADPLPSSAAQYRARDIATGLAYTPPALADDIVIHAGENLLVQLWAADENGLLASDSSIVAVSGADAVGDGRVADVRPGTQVTVQLADGGSPTVHHARAGDVSEVTSIELTAMKVMPTKVVVHAVARIEDGGVYYAPPIEWSADEQLQPYDYSGGGPKFPRRSDVTSWDLKCTVDGGAPVTASINGLTATVAIPCVAPEEFEAPPAPEKKQGCATVPGELLGLALVAWLGRRRRSV